MSIIIKRSKTALKARSMSSRTVQAKASKAKIPLVMKSPPHPGRLLRDTLDAFGLSIAAAAEGLAVTRQQLNNVCTGRSSMTPDMAVRLERAFEGSAEIWMKLQIAFDLAAARARTDSATIRQFPRRVA